MGKYWSNPEDAAMLEDRILAHTRLIEDRRLEVAAMRLDLQEMLAAYALLRFGIGVGVVVMASTENIRPERERRDDQVAGDRLVGEPGRPGVGVLAGGAAGGAGGVDGQCARVVEGRAGVDGLGDRGRVGRDPNCEGGL